jgi:alpha-tubulin suppressor-like RCC1 family protein
LGAVCCARRCRAKGSNRRNQLDDRTATQRLLPISASGIPTPLIGISLGVVHTCAVDANHQLHCWGDNYSGQLGDGTPRLYADAEEALDLLGVFYDSFE